MIRFFTEEISFELQGKRATREWISRVIQNQTLQAGDINYIFCSDSFLLDINAQYLNHHSLTDIVTFDQSDDSRLEGDIYISIERVRENAAERSISFTDELHRVMIHGILHLAGFNDKSTKEKQLMREKEDECLSLRK